MKRKAFEREKEKKNRKLFIGKSVKKELIFMIEFSSFIDINRMNERKMKTKKEEDGGYTQKHVTIFSHIILQK